MSDRKRDCERRGGVGGERERERENERKRLVQTELPFGHSYTAIMIASKINIH